MLAGAACSAGNRASPPAPAVTTTVGAPVTATAPPTLPATTVVPVSSTKPIPGPTGVLGFLTSVDGAGPATVAIPAAAGRPVIVHAQYDGADKFEVDAVDPHGRQLAILATSLGPYLGSFPVGFVDRPDDPTAALRVTTTGAWHLDIANAVVAPPLSGRGESGHGDAVMVYKGPAVTTHLRYAGTAAFIVDVFDNGAQRVLVRTIGPYDGSVALPAGPGFVSVTAAGDWSMSLG